MLLRTVSVISICLLILATAVIPGEAAKIIYVKTTGANTNDGLSWITAKKTVQAGINAASSGDQVWVAKGTYKPTAGTSRTVSFVLKDGVAVYGGFAGSEGATYNLASRDFVAQETILSGEIGVKSSKSDNTYQVVIGANNARLDGFTITGGYANGAWPYLNGGGMYNMLVSPTVANCTFVENSAVGTSFSVVSSGAGIHNYYSNTVMTKCTFRNNAATPYGQAGGIYNTGGTPWIEDCIFEENVGYINGGAIANSVSTPVIERCTFTGNLANGGTPEMATGSGSAISNYQSNATISDCAFTGNFATAWGTVYNGDSNPIIDRCTFVRNTAEDGGGIVNWYSSDATISNCIFTGNITSNCGGGIETSSSSPTITRCVFVGNSSHNGGAMSFRGSSAAQVANCTIVSNTALPVPMYFCAGGGLYIDSSNPTLTDCIIWSNSSNNGPQIYTASSSPSITYSDIDGAWTGTGNINSNPLFVEDPFKGADGQWGTADDDYGDVHLVFDSPCIDKGSDGTIDMGAYEYAEVPPVNVSLSPASGMLAASMKTTLTTIYSNAEGATNIAECRLLINTTLSNLSCINVMYNTSTKKFHLRSDAGSSWGTGYPAGDSHVLENSACKLYPAGCSAVASGTTLTLKFSVEPKATMVAKTQPCKAWMRVADAGGLVDNWEEKGTLQFGFPPTNDSLSPASGNLPIGSKQMLTLKLSDLSGLADLAQGRLLINTTLSGANCIHVMYDANQNKFYVRNDANTSWGTGYAPGTDQVLENSYCKLYCKDCTKSGSGNTLTLTFVIEPKATMSGKTYKAWMRITDDTGLMDDWEEKGSFTFHAPLGTEYSPQGASLAVGTKYTFEYSCEDAKGAADIAQSRLLINTTLSGAKCINVMYNESQNKLYVRNDANTGWLGGYAPGSDNVIQNTYCKLYCKDTTKTASGNKLTVDFVVEPKAILAGKICPAWVRCTDDSGLVDSWIEAAVYSIRPAGLDWTTTASGLMYRDTLIGTGAVATIGDTVSVDYSGWLDDDNAIFDTSIQPGRTPFSFTIGAQEVIPGWDEGLQGVKVGGIRELRIPPELGYGSSGSGGIPPNSTLNFVVQLVEIGT